jgi:hypothetical protein
MNITVQIMLGPDDQALKMTPRNLARATLKSVGGDPKVDSCSVQISQSATLMPTPMPPLATANVEGGE